MTLAESGVIALVVGFVLGLIGRQLLRSRVRLSMAEATLCGIVGAIVGAGAVSLILGRPDERKPLAAGLGAVIGTVIVLLIVDRYFWATRRPSKSASELIAAGESATVEFKSTARYNTHTKQRDERMEQVIVKTVAGFANANGGTLLIGVADDGAALGLDNDLKLMKAPDLDRYELWLRDLLETSCGVVAVTDISIEFQKIFGDDVCLVRVPQSTRPVVVSTGKDKRRAMYVRTGNSTRELEIDEALVYATKRWGRRSLKKALG